MSVNLKKSIKICFIVIVVILSNFLLFSETFYAEKKEMMNNKPVMRGIAEVNIRPKKLEEVEKYSDLIIKGIIQDGKEPLMPYEDFGYTKTKVLVTEVIKGDKDLLNQIIVYREPYFELIIKGVSEGYVISENYQPAIVNNEYILFLGEYDGSFEPYKDAYSLMHFEKGKYLVNNNLKRMRTTTSAYVDSLSNKELNIGPDDSEVYRDIYKNVIDKYILKTNKESIKSQENVSENNEKETTIKTVNLDENKSVDKNGNIIIPISAAAELLDCKIEWNGDTKTAIAKKDDIIVEFPINQNYYILNGNQHNTNTKAEIYNNRTYISINTINEAFGIEIVYNDAENTISLLHSLLH